MMVLGIATGMYTGLLNNYLYEMLHIDKVQRGIVEFPRELPGLALVFILALLYRFSEIKIIRIATLLSLTGLLGMAIAGSNRVMAILMIILYSSGEHLVMPLRKSIAIHAAKPGMDGFAMGSAASAGNIGQVLGNYLVPVLFLVLSIFFNRSNAAPFYRILLLTASGIGFIAFVLVGRLADKEKHVRRARLYFRRKYIKYYVLEIFFGARKQIFLTFAPYVLILQYGAKTELLSLLYGVWSLSNIFLNPLIGRLVDRIGYKKVIVFDTIILLFLCFLYGFSHRLFPEKIAFIVICFVFVLDAVLFAVGLARAVYVKSLSENQEEVTSTLTTGLSINHFISIIIAILGGLLWEHLGIEFLFSAAAVFSIFAFFFSLTIPTPYQAVVKVKD